MDAASALPSPGPGLAATERPQAPGAERARIHKVARDYEQSFLSVMLAQMQAGVKAEGFGGGTGEEAFKSFLNDAMAKGMVARGGIGLAPRLEAEMLKLQGYAP